MEKKSCTTIGMWSFPISARSWAVYNAENGTLIQSKSEKARREVASLTKMMTAFTAIQLIKKFDVNIYASKIEAPFEASIVGGTTANLLEGDLLSVWEMLHAMLLPSGNDAAYSIAEYFGILLLEHSTLSPSTLLNWDPVRVFVGEMNSNAKALGMTATNYANPHGLQNIFNKSTALDLCKLASACMNLQIFSDIVRKPKFSCIGTDVLGYKKLFTWYNTNKMLTKGFIGIKTGVTQAAGPCLATCFLHNGDKIIIVLLGSKAMEIRWSETLALRKAAIQALDMIKPSAPKTADGARMKASIRLSPVRSGGS